MSNLKKVLVIGSGGRENAICWKLAQSERVHTVFALPGSDHIGRQTKVNLIKNISVKDHGAIVEWCKKEKIDLVVVGPEDPLADGIADALLDNGLPCFGPTSKGAQIEADKSWSKDFMKRFQIPTARYETFDCVVKAKQFIKRYVVFFSNGKSLSVFSFLLAGILTLLSLSYL